MSHVIRRRLPVLAALASAGLAAGVVSAGAAPSAAAPAARTAKLAVGVEVLHFSSSGRTTTANGLLTATLSDTLGHVTTIRDNVALTAAVGGSGCRVLHLFLNELTLNLLGLTAHLDKVTLDITGNASGGVLGSLFCRLAHAKIASVRAATIAALNRGVKQQPQHALAFTAYLHPAKARRRRRLLRPRPRRPPLRRRPRLRGRPRPRPRRRRRHARSSISWSARSTSSSSGSSSIYSGSTSTSRPPPGRASSATSSARWPTSSPASPPARWRAMAAAIGCPVCAS